MGVLGLTTFVDNNHQLLTDHRLHDTRVLVDGNNLYYFLYYRYFNINICYGGDYDCYANSIRYYFNALKTCNIFPFVIFDGGYDTEKKLKTTIQRQYSRLKSIKCLIKGQKGQVFPILANEVFKQVLAEMGVCHVTCDFEADEQLAALAKAWNCPIMSNDSDFFIFDLPAGFIIFDYLDLKIKHYAAGKDLAYPEGYKYLSVQLYKVENMIKSYSGLQRDRLPIFSALMGNDFVDAEDFELFFTHLNLPTVGNVHGRVKQRVQKVTGLLMWLASQESFEHTICYIVNCYPKAMQKKVRDSLDSSVQIYTTISHLEYFDSDNGKVKTSSMLQTFDGNPMPDWIVSGLRKGEIPVFIINTLTLHRNMLLPQVEVLTEHCSFACSQRLRTVIYSILLSLDAKANNCPAPQNGPKQKICIQEYHRSNNGLTCECVEPMNELPGGSPIPYLQKIPHMFREEREGLFWESVGFRRDSFKDLPNELHLIVAAMCYWLKHATPKVAAHFLYALVACLIRLMLLKDLAKENTESEDESAQHPNRIVNGSATQENRSDNNISLTIGQKDNDDNLEMDQKEESADGDNLEMDQKNYFADGDNLEMNQKNNSADGENLEMNQKNNSADGENLEMDQKESADGENSEMDQKEGSAAGENLEMDQKEESADGENLEMDQKENSADSQNLKMDQKDKSVNGENLEMDLKNKSTDDENLEMDQKEKPMDGDDLEMDQKDKSADGENLEMDQTDNSTDGENLEMDQKEMPVDGDVFEMDQKDKTADGENLEMDQKDESADSENLEIDQKEKPMDGEDLEMDPKDKSGDSDNLEMDQKEKPVDGTDLEMDQKNKLACNCISDPTDVCGMEVNVYAVSSQKRIHNGLKALRKCHPLAERRIAAKKTDRFMIETSHQNTGDDKFQVLITHNFNQFQTCLLAMMQLNMLLLQPLCNCYPALVFNGTFLYNLCVELQKRSMKRTYICEQFGLKSSLSKLYFEIVDAVLRVVPVAEQDEDSGGGRKKKRKKKERKCPQYEDTDEEGVQTDSGVTETLQVKCELTNRFMGLCLEDE